MPQLLLVACCALAPALVPAVDPPPPANLLVVYVDDMGADVELPVVQTPRIDSLRARGVRFLRAYPAATVCTPSRVALLSGQLPHHTQIVYNAAVQPPRSINGVMYLPCELRAAGYHAAGVGKLFHTELNDCWDEYADFADDPWIEKPFVSHFPPMPASVLSGPFLNGPDGSLGKMADTKRADRAVELLAAARARLDGTGQPFALWVGFEATHEPFVYPEAYHALYAPEDVPPLPALEQSAWKADVSTWAWKTNWKYDPQSAPTEDERRIVARMAYFRCITYLDHEIGRVLDALDALGLAQDTLVVLVGDHGWSFSEHDHLGKTTGYDEDALAPLVVAAPALPETHGRAVTTPVSQVDLYPTLMDLLGLPHPSPLDGASLLPLLMDVSAPHVPAMYTTDEEYGFNITRHVVKRDASTGHVWKLGAWEHDDFIPQVHQLYDLTVDPGEYVNRHADAHVAGIVAELRSDLLEAGLLGPLARNFSIGVPGTWGVPALRWSGVPALGAAGSLEVGNVAGTAVPGLLVVGFSGSFPGPKAPGVKMQFQILLALPAAGLTLPVVLPANPALHEVPLGLQLLHADAGSDVGLARSRALSLFLAHD